MMQTPADWGALALETIRDPETASRRIMDWDLPRGVLYQALIAVAALNAVVAGIGALLSPVNPALPAFLDNPLVMFGLIAGGVVLWVHLVYWTGRAMGGTGRIVDVLALFVWLQMLRLAAQILMFVTSLLIPGLALLIAFAVMILGIWLMLHFVRAAMRLSSLMQAGGVLIATLAGLVIGLMLLITLLGVENMEMISNV